MRTTRFVSLGLLLLFGAAFCTPASAQVLFFEGFEGVTLEESVNERIGTAISERVATDPDSSPVPNVWTPNGPAGWTVDNTLDTYNGAATVTPGVPGTGLADYGVDEWEGWSFTRMDFWSVKDDQDRSMFGSTSGASGILAVADPDEYFDLGSQNDAVNGGYYSTSLTTPSFNISGDALYALGFASSWRDEAFDDNALGDTYVDENNQSVEIVVTFNTGETPTIIQWDSDSGDLVSNGVPFKDDAQDELIPADGSGPAFFAPAGATSATVSFRLANAGNDWWWAVDNIEVVDLGGDFVPSGDDVQVFAEDFEGLAGSLQDSVNERLVAGAGITTTSDGVTTILGTDYPTTATPDAYTHNFPADWTTDNAGTPGAGGGDDGFGVLEWEQWSIASKDFWAGVAGQTRDQFTKATGNVAVADGDEWDDLGDPDSQGELTTFMRTPMIDVSGETDVTIDFDSSWRPEDDQIAELVALLDGNELQLMRWESSSNSPNFHAADRNEDVGFIVDTTGISELQLEFRYVGRDDWWWAVDNIRVQSGAITALVPEPASATAVTLLGLCGLAIRRRRCALGFRWICSSSLVAGPARWSAASPIQASGAA